jgi:hypothetical protein
MTPRIPSLPGAASTGDAVDPSDRSRGNAVHARIVIGPVCGVGGFTCGRRFCNVDGVGASKSSIGNDLC